MRVLAARFPDRRVASAVRELLRRRMHVAPPDVEIAPLANTDRPATDDTVLACRLDERAAVVVTELVEDAGGEIVADVDERWTRPRQVPRVPSWMPH